jgi:membrane-bound serine protease (ClpP class)
MLSPLSFADPNLAFTLLVLGALGVLWELHAPGMFVPGLVGILSLCAGAYGLYQDSPSRYGLTLIAAALLLLAIELKYYTHMISGLTGTMLLALGATAILQGPRQISPVLALAVSVALGLITIFLGFLGMRARKNKRIMGLESLVGEVGVARTEIHPAGAYPPGTVFVNGEYWQALSQAPIPPGQRVRVERVQDLIVYVKEA